MIFGKNKKRVKELVQMCHELNDAILKMKSANKHLADQLQQEREKNRPSMADLMRESLGTAVDFSDVNDKCKPPHYLRGLSDEERKNFVADMETIYSNDKFQKVVRYLINLFAVNIVYKEDKEQMKYNQVAVTSFRLLLNQFDEMHTEFLSNKKGDESFDEHAVLPE